MDREEIEELAKDLISNQTQTSVLIRVVHILEFPRFQIPNIANADGNDLP